jgi:putative redox protein
MEFGPVVISVSYAGDMQFIAENAKGMDIIMDAPVHQGGPGKNPTPIDYIIASLGGCIGVKIVLSLSDRGIVPDFLKIGILAERNDAMPAVFNKVHLDITITAPVDDEVLTGILDLTLSHYCPIAAMFAEVGELTYDYQITLPE